MPALRRAAGGSACNAVLHSGIEHERRLTLTVGFRRLVVGTPKQTTPSATTSSSTAVASEQCCCGSLPTSTSSPAPAASRSWSTPRSTRMLAPNAADGSPSRRSPSPRTANAIRQCRQALCGFQKERWRRGEADPHPFDRDIYRRSAPTASRGSALRSSSPVRRGGSRSGRPSRGSARARPNPPNCEPSPYGRLLYAVVGAVAGCHPHGSNHTPRIA